MAKKLSNRNTKNKSKNINSNITVGKSDCKYQTIASLEHDYDTFEIMNEYESLEEARNSYSTDMKVWKNQEEHQGYLHFAIREVKKTN